MEEENYTEIEIPEDMKDKAVEYRNRTGYLWGHVKKELSKPGNGKYFNRYKVN